MPRACLHQLTSSAAGPTGEQFRQVEPFVPVHRGHVLLNNLQAGNTFLYVAANGCKWCSLPRRFGNEYTS